MSKRNNKKIRINIITVDIVSIIAIITGIFGIIMFFRNPCTFSSCLNLIFSALDTFLAAMNLAAAIVARKEYKIKKNKNIPREYYFEKDIRPKDDLFQITVVMILFTVITLILITTC